MVLMPEAQSRTGASEDGGGTVLLARRLPVHPVCAAAPVGEALEEVRSQHERSIAVELAYVGGNESF